MDFISNKVVVVCIFSMFLFACRSVDQQQLTVVLDCDQTYTSCSSDPQINIHNTTVDQFVDAQVDNLLGNKASVLLPNIDPILFEFDQFSFIQPQLSSATKFLLSNRQTRVTLHGHADQIGSESYNQELSNKRALAVKKLLLDAGVYEDQIHTIAYGESSPKVLSKSDDNVMINATLVTHYAPNRRVEFTFELAPFIAQSH